MAKVTAKIEGIPEFLQRTDDIGRRVRAAVRQAVQVGAVNVHRTAVESILREAKSGLVYEMIFRVVNGQAVPVGPREGENLSATHQASAPGQAPASDTGNLVSRINFNVEDEKIGPAAYVTSSAQYSFWLEYGTRNMEPRPFMQPALEANRTEIVDDMRDRIRKALRDGTR